MSPELDAPDGPADRPYDTLPPEEQAARRAQWAERMAARRAELDLAVEFEAAGRSYVELDDGGQVVRRRPPQPK